MTLRTPALMLAAALTLLGGGAMAQPPAATPEPNAAPDAVAAAREAFRQGAAHAQEARWGAALERFEASSKLKPHAGTTYNIGICHRALGRYALARATFRRALSEHRASGDTELAPSLVENTRAYLEETEAVLARFTVTLVPAGAAIAVDGRPLEVFDDGKLIAGTQAPGPGRAPPSRRFELVLDPGTHVFMLSHPEYGDIVVRETIGPGESRKLDLQLERLPAQLSVRSSEALAAVSIDGVDVGTAPVELVRPAGSYHVLVHKDGFEPYESDVLLRSAQQMSLSANLQPETPELYERWWFWTSVGAAVATAAVVTYFIVKPEPERPPLDGGGLGWAIRVP